MSNHTVNSWNGIFFEAAQEVLETMFFSSVFGPAEPLYLSSAVGRERIITAELRFAGTPSGRVQISLTQMAAYSIAGNFLGQDDPDLITDEEVESVAGELANMVCGSALSKMDAQSVFSLSHPEMKLIEIPRENSNHVVASFELADGVMTSQIFFDTLVSPLTEPSTFERIGA